MFMSYTVCASVCAHNSRPKSPYEHQKIIAACAVDYCEVIFLRCEIKMFIRVAGFVAFSDLYSVAQKESIFFFK